MTNKHNSDNSLARLSNRLDRLALAQRPTFRGIRFHVVEGDVRNVYDEMGVNGIVQEMLPPGIMLSKRDMGQQLNRALGLDAFEYDYLELGLGLKLAAQEFGIRDLGIVVTDKGVWFSKQAAESLVNAVLKDAATAKRFGDLVAPFGTPGPEKSGRGV